MALTRLCFLAISPHATERTYLARHAERNTGLVEHAAAFIKGMEAGWTQSLERLQALVTLGT
jgi:hypothetical protein